MSIFPLAANLTLARAPDAPRARTEDEATTIAGGPVFLAVEELPQAFDTPEAAEQAVPELYGAGLYELLWRDGAWRASGLRQPVSYRVATQESMGPANAAWLQQLCADAQSRQK